jgi:hypothetical protein
MHCDHNQHMLVDALDAGKPAGHDSNEQARRRDGVGGSYHAARGEPAAPLAERLGYDFLVESLFTRMRCMVCSSKRVDLLPNGSDK